MTDVDELIDELLILWPALPTALPRDAGTVDGERVTTSATVHTVPLNVDVAAVITDLTRNVPDWTSWAAAAAGLAGVSFDVPACLRRLPGIHARLDQLGRTRDAERLTTQIQHWHTASRRALGLDRPDRPFGEHCPRHDDPLQLLVQPGDHGRLVYAKLDAAGRPVDARIEWSRIEIVLCRHCDAMWTPERYMLLGRLIKQADRDRAAQAEEEAGDAA